MCIRDRFYANTLNATQASAGLGAAPGVPDGRADDFIGLFGAIYRHALELIGATPALTCLLYTSRCV